MNQMGGILKNMGNDKILIYIVDDDYFSLLNPENIWDNDLFSVYNNLKKEGERKYWILYQSEEFRKRGFGKSMDGLNRNNFGSNELKLRISNDAKDLKEEYDAYLKKNEEAEAKKAKEAAVAPVAPVTGGRKSHKKRERKSKRKSQRRKSRRYKKIRKY